MTTPCIQPSDNGKNQSEKNEVHRKAESDKRLGSQNASDQKVYTESLFLRSKTALSLGTIIWDWRSQLVNKWWLMLKQPMTYNNFAQRSKHARRSSQMRLKTTKINLINRLRETFLKQSESCLRVDVSHKIVNQVWEVCVGMA